MNFIQGWTVGIVGIHVLVLGMCMADNDKPGIVLLTILLHVPIWGRVLGWW